jgi:Carboxypeptidase regulatory-like domain
MRKLRIGVAALLLCFVLSAHVLAQTSNPTLGGTLADVSGALIPAVTITAANTQTSIATTVVSNEAGAYQFARLQTGIYRVRAELPGFQTQTWSDVALGVNANVNF